MEQYSSRIIIPVSRMMKTIHLCWDKGFGHSLHVGCGQQYLVFLVSVTENLTGTFDIYGDQVFSLINQFTGEIYLVQKRN